MPDLPTDPLSRVEALLRARQVSSRGSLADLAHALVHAAGVAQLDARAHRLAAELAAAEAIAVREHHAAAATHRRLNAVLTDRDTLVVQLELVCDAIAAFRDHPTQPADAVEQAVDDARALLADDGLTADLDDVSAARQTSVALRPAA